MASFMTPLFPFVRVRTNHLATKQLLLKIAKLYLQIQLCTWRQGESLSSIADLVLEQSLVNDSSGQIYHE